MITLLTTPEALNSPALAHRYMVELASIELVLDAYGVPVPAATKTVDVLVIDANDIATFLRVTGDLEGYNIIKQWIPEDCDCF